MQAPTTRRDFLTAGAAGLTAAFLGCRRTGSVRNGFEDKDAPADLILINGRITTLDKRRPSASAVAMKGGRFVAVGDDQDVLHNRGDKTRVVDLQRKTVIPGLNDSHLHL